MNKYAFGVDLGGTTVKMGLFTSDGTLLDVWEIPTRTENGGQFILSDIANAVDAKLEDKHIVKDEVIGVGIGVPGPVAPDGTVFRCANLGWGVFNVEQTLSQLCGLKVKAGNDANVAALGETWKGGGEGYNDIVMVTLGTGVGGGVIIGGKILAGVNGAAGEIGHIPMRDDETEICGCGKKGCLEQYTSANGVARMARKYLAEHPDEETELRKFDTINSKVLFDAAKDGDAVALKIVDDFGNTLGKGLASISCVVNPEAFVIGGGLSKAGNIVIDAVQKYYWQYSFHACRNAEFKLATLGNSAGIYGGVKMVLD